MGIFGSLFEPDNNSLYKKSKSGLDSNFGNFLLFVKLNVNLLRT